MLNAVTAPLWFEPVPHDDPDRAGEFRGLNVAPTLEERLSRLPVGPPPDADDGTIRTASG
jgi:hypothetical protein